MADSGFGRRWADLRSGWDPIVYHKKARLEMSVVEDKPICVRHTHMYIIIYIYVVST